MSDVTPQQIELVITAATNALLTPILNLLQADPHQWSNRPCSTCRTIGGLVGRKFGCYLYAERLAEKEARKP